VVAAIAAVSLVSWLGMRGAALGQPHDRDLRALLLDTSPSAACCTPGSSS
jgi:hypothetical protein